MQHCELFHKLLMYVIAIHHKIVILLLSMLSTQYNYTIVMFAANSNIVKTSRALPFWDKGF